MNRPPVLLPLLLALHGLAASFTASGAPEAKNSPEDFSHRIAPILREHCGGCHMADKKKGGFSMNTHAAFLSGSENGAVVDSGDSSKSLLLRVLRSNDPEIVMPPPDKGKPRPTPAQLQLLEEWIRAGAPWQEGFAFHKPSYNAPLTHRAPVLPPASAGSTHPVDRILSEYYAKHSLNAPSPADDATFVRRVHMDLVGLPPSPDQLDAFLGDRSPHKRARLIESLLSRSGDYAEHWLTFWNDLLRNDYGGTGFITGGRRQISAWLYAALASNKPYDQMVRELVNPSPETEGFAQGITWRGTVSASQTREVQFAQSVSQSFLGLNFKCASCHDSFIDHWKLTDAYGLAAVYADKPIEIARCEKLTGKTAKPAWPFPELGQIPEGASREERLKKLADLMTHKDNGWFARTMANRLWAQLMGRGLVHPVDTMGTEPWNEALLDHLGWAFAQCGYNLRELLRIITTSNAYQSQTALRQKDDDTGEFRFRGPRAKRMSAEQFMDTVWQITRTAPRSWDAPVRRGQPIAELVASRPALPSAWMSAPSQAPATDGAPGAQPPKNALPALRKVLPLEQKPILAAGILASPGGWRVFLNGSELKAPHATKFEAVTELHLEALLQKGENVLTLVGAPRDPKAPQTPVFFALELEFPGGQKQTLFSGTDWVAHLSLTEDLIKKTKLSPTAPELSADQWVGAAAAQPGAGEAFSTARLQGDLVWAVQPRAPARAALMKSDLLMRTLGRPNRDQIVTNRPQDLSTLEALDLSAGAKLSEILAAGARNLSLDPKLADATSLVGWIFKSALGREPSAGEQAAAFEMLGQKPTQAQVEDLLWSIFVLPEFQLVR